MKKVIVIRIKYKIMDAVIKVTMHQFLLME